MHFLNVTASTAPLTGLAKHIVRCQIRLIQNDSN